MCGGGFCMWLGSGIIKQPPPEMPVAEHLRVQEAKKSIILVLARNGHHIKIRSHHHILMTRPGNNMDHSMGSRMMKPTYPLLRVHRYLFLALRTREVHAYETHA